MAFRTRSSFIKTDLASNSSGLHTILGRGDFITQTGTKPHIYIEAEWTLYHIQAAVRPLQNRNGALCPQCNKVFLRSRYQYDNSTETCGLCSLRR